MLKKEIAMYEEKVKQHEENLKFCTNVLKELQNKGIENEEIQNYLKMAIYVSGSCCNVYTQDLKEFKALVRTQNYIDKYNISELKARYILNAIENDYPENVIQFMLDERTPDEELQLLNSWRIRVHYSCLEEVEPIFRKGLEPSRINMLLKYGSEYNFSREVFDFCAKSQYHLSNLGIKLIGKLLNDGYKLEEIKPLFEERMYKKDIEHIHYQYAGLHMSLEEIIQDNDWLAERLCKKDSLDNKIQNFKNYNTDNKKYETYKVKEEQLR